MFGKWWVLCSDKGHIYSEKNGQIGEIIFNVKLKSLNTNILIPFLILRT